MINTPFNYTGSKFKMLDVLLPEFDYTKNSFVDVFSGGGSVFTNIVDKYDNVIVNDIITDLIETMKNMIDDKDKFIEDLTKYFVSTKDEYNNLRDEYNKEKNYIKFYSLLLSCTNNMIRFNKKFEFNQTYGERGFNPKTKQKIDTWVEHMKKYKVNFMSSDFSNIKIDNDTMYYLDPPYGYIKNGNTIGNKQITEAGYNAFWTKNDEMKLYNFIMNIHSIGGSFVISGVLEHDDKTSWLLDKIKDDFNIKYIEYDYEKVAKKKNKNTKEVIIKNF